MESVPSIQAALEREAQRVEEDALYSAKGHFEAARRWNQVHFWIGLPAAVMSAGAGVSALSDEGLLAGVLALFVAALTATATFLNPSNRSTMHHQAGTQFNGVRNRARFFREIELGLGRTDADLALSLRELTKERDDLNVSSPQIPRWAFEKARRAIEAGEATYLVDSD